MSAEAISTGWGSPSEQPSSATSRNREPRCRPEIRGWKRISLYSLLVFLMTIIFVNLALTLWLMTIMRFNVDGMGPIRVTKEGIEVMGQTLVSGALIASTISSKLGQSISIHSYDNLTFSRRDDNGNLEKDMFIGHNKFECNSQSFVISDELGKVLLSVDEDHVHIGVDKLTLAGDGGAVFKGSVLTPVVKADSGQDLTLESSTRSINVRAASRITLESRAGGIHASALNNLEFISTAGSIQLNSSHVYIRDLKIAQPQPRTASPTPAFSTSESPTPRAPRRRQTSTFQLCACEDGKLFLANDQGSCEISENDDVCR